MNTFLATVSAGVLTYITIPTFSALLVKGNALRPNYLGKSVAVGGGYLLLWVGSLCLIAGGLDPRTFLLWTATALAFGSLGFFDDMLGSREQSGLKGHFLALWRGNLTTGAFKALLGFSWALALSLFGGGEGSLPSGHFWPLAGQMALNGTLIAGGANLLNLLDLRPGRAGKVFLMGTFAITLWGQIPSLPIVAFAGAVIGYLPYDLRGLVMLGDAGANGLGALLGLAALQSFAYPLRLALAGIIVVAHLLAEKVSFSELIAKSPLLQALDKWGRPDT